MRVLDTHKERGSLDVKVVVEKGCVSCRKLVEKHKSGRKLHRKKVGVVTQDAQKQRGGTHGERVGRSLSQGLGQEEDTTGRVQVEEVVALSWRGSLNAVTNIVLRGREKT